MKYTVQFQYKDPESARPEDCSQDEENEIVIEDGSFTPLPNVGDSVSYKYGGRVKAFMVLSRHFDYQSPNWCIINIVVTDISDDEINARIKS